MPNYFALGDLGLYLRWHLSSYLRSKRSIVLGIGWDETDVVCAGIDSTGRLCWGE